MRCFFYIALATIMMPGLLSAQDKEPDLTRPFLYLNNGSILSEHQFQVNNNISKFKDLNGKKIALKNIRFYQSGSEYFAAYKGKLAPREQTGIFDIYARHYSGYYNASTNRVIPPASYYYYAQGFGEVKQLKYNNLKTDLTAFPNNRFPEEERIILDLLQKGKKRDTTREILRWTGAASMLASLVLLGSGNKGGSSGNYQQNSYVAPLALSLGGAGLLIAYRGINGGYVFYEDAVKSYNIMYGE
ncbi:MAG: hypothetical protein IAE84_18665 [Saprospiraceae bacterium]|nr:hypothetical protein [Saprospiraceae bacterium]